MSTDSMPPNEATTASNESQSQPASDPLMAEDTKVKFASSEKSSSAVVDLSAAGKVSSKEFIALTQAQLEHYQHDPFWIRLRWSLFILFWLAWVAMLACAIGIIYVTPKCPRPAPKQWWQTKPIYKLYTNSFKDSDGDGIGDINGIRSKLDYLVDLGVGSVWISPIYKSPMKDNGYDIQDFTAIDSVFGTMDDFENLVKELREKDIRLIMDFVPNHSSKEHEWFAKSILREAPFDDYYVWAAGNDTIPPNNWKSVFSGSAWEYHTTRGEWYLHQFMKEQPDLNLRNPQVVEQLQSVLKFWLDKGVDGFRIDSVAHFFEDPSLRDEETRAAFVGKGTSSYEHLDHKYTFNLPSNLQLLAQFKSVLNEATKNDSRQRVMMTEAYLPSSELNPFYGDSANGKDIPNLSQIPLNFDFISLFKDQSAATAKNVANIVANYHAGLKKGAWPNYNLGNHDNPRIATRVGSDLVDVMNTLILLLPGTPLTYYGEEIGMTDIDDIKTDQRDPERSPMQWDNSSNAGFMSGNKSEPWLHVNLHNLEVINVASQLKTPRSHLSNYRQLSKLRSQASILIGDVYSFVQDEVFVFSRIKRGHPAYLVVLNFGSEAVANINIMSQLHGVSSEGKIYLETPGIGGEADDGSSRYVSLDDITVKGKQALVISFVSCGSDC